MKKIKLFIFILGMTSIMLFKPEVSIAQTLNQPGFLVYSRDISTPNLLSFDLNGSINNFPAPTGHVEVYNDRICISHYAGSYIDNFKIYDFQANLLKTISIPVQLTTCLNFIVLPNLNFALLDNVNDKIYFLDNNGSLQKTINILDSPSPIYQSLDGVVVGNSLIFSENEKKQLLKIDLDNYNVSVFKDFSNFAGSLGAIDYNNGRFYICTADAGGRKIYTFIDGQPEKLVFTLPGSTSYITSIVAYNNFIYATFVYDFRILKVNISNGDYTVFYSAPAGTFYPYDIEGINLNSLPVPNVVSVAASEIAITSATLNGKVNAKNANTTVQFEYWTTNGNISSVPATPSSVTGTIDTEVSAHISGLDAGTTYYYRVKAENTNGATFSDVLTFTTYKADAITDIDGNFYNIVTIGSQVWMAENLKATTFNNGTGIQEVSDNDDWINLVTPGYCFYNNDAATFKATYGALYNFYTVDAESNGGKNVCPTGWHVPLYAEWMVLINYLGGMNEAGGKLKANGTIDMGDGLWQDPNLGATNESGFTALPGGFRWGMFNTGVFGYVGSIGQWWSTTEYPTDPSNVYTPRLQNSISNVSNNNSEKEMGFSIRCIMNSAPYTVTNTNDAGTGSLRSALEYSNQNPGNDVITFNIPGPGPFTIQPVTPLPQITDPVVIDGFSQSGASASNLTLMIELSGTNLSTGGVGLTISTDNCIIRGLAINRFRSDQVLITGISPVSTHLSINNSISGNFIGTDITGKNIYASNLDGVGISIAGDNNKIGGNTSSERNIICGNVHGIMITGKGNSVFGNYVGTDISGKLPLMNYGTGILINWASDNTIGGAGPGERNVISGNNQSGITVQNSTSTGNKIVGNYIGVDVTGQLHLGNGDCGIRIQTEASDNVIGGSNPGEGNVISNNSNEGILIKFTSTDNIPKATQRNTIKGNYIGTDANRTESHGNGKNGIRLDEYAINNLIGGPESGEGNIIAFNGNSGVLCAGITHPSSGNSILSNSIHSNSGLGIDLGAAGVTTNDNNDVDPGPNNLQNFPVLKSVSFSPGYVKISGTLNSEANKKYTLQFFANKVKDGSDYGEGETYLEPESKLPIEVTTTGNVADFTVTLPIKGVYGQVITATATDPDGNTSEFSKYVGGLADQVAGFTWPIRYVYNSTGAEKITDGTDIKAITNSFDTWSNISTAITKFESSGPTDMTVAVAGDGINLVSFMDNEYDWPEGVLAYASKTTQMDAGGVNGKIIDADIIVNPAFKDVLIGTTGLAGEVGTPGYYDIQSIITHEIGHILGLLHSGLTRSTMFFWMHKASIGKRTLESDDIAWASYKYPGNTYSSTYGTLTGNITYGYDAKPVAGALLTAINSSNGISFHSYSDADGNYIIPVLSGSNQYYIHIEPLDGDVNGYPMTPLNISSYIYSNTVYTDYPNEYFNTEESDGSLVNGIPSDNEIMQTPVGVSNLSRNIITNKDLTPPEVVSITPDMIGLVPPVVKILPDIIITFSEPVDLTSFTDASCYLQMGTGTAAVKYSGSVSQWEGNTESVIFTPITNLPNKETFTLHLLGQISETNKGITDLRGNSLASEYTAYSITTIDSDKTPPRVTGSVPGNGVSGVFVTDNIIVSFSEPMNKTTVKNNYTFTGGGCSLTWGDNGSTVTIDPDNSLLEGINYMLTLSNEITDLNGVHLLSDYVVSFTTAYGNPKTTYIGPGDNDKDVSVNTPIVVDFSEPIDKNSIDWKGPLLTFTLREILSEANGIPLYGDPIPGSFEFMNNNSRVIFRPDVDLKFSQTVTPKKYRIELTTGIKDVSQPQSMSLQNDEYATFTTAIQPSAPSISYIEKPTGVAGDEVIISGKGFDPDPTKNLVSFAGKTATVERATLTSLNVAVPTGTIAGEVTVKVKGSTSEGYFFYIVKPSDVLPDDWGTSSTPIGNGTHSTDLIGDCTIAFVTNSGSNSVSVVDINNLGVLKWRYDIPVGEIPMDIAINSTDTRAYVTNYGSHTISVIDLTTVKSNPIDPTKVVVKDIDVGINPYGIAVVPDGDFVYVANYTSQNLSVIDVNPNSGGFDHAVTSVDLKSGGKGSDVTGDAGLVLVATDNGLKIVNINSQSKEFDCFNCVVETASSSTSMKKVDVAGDASYAIATTEDGRLLIIDVLPGSDYFGTAVAGTSSSSPITSGQNAGDGLHIYATTENHDLLIFEITPGGVGVPVVDGSYTGIINLKLVGKKSGLGNDAVVVDALNQRLFTVDSKLNPNGSSNGTLYLTGLYVPPQKPEDRIAGLIQNVQELMYGSLKRAKGNSLISDLNRAIVYINNQRNKDAINRLNTFINNVKALIKSHSLYAPEENEKAQQMIVTANEIIAQLKGAKSGDEELINTDANTQSNLDVVTETKLGIIYPNPSKEAITINYEIAENEMGSEKVTIQVYDVIGRLIGNLVNENQTPGRYSTKWKGYYDNGGQVPRGFYFIRFSAGSVREVRQIMLIR